MTTGIEDVPEIILVQNWSTELERLVPKHLQARLGRTWPDL